MEACAYLSDADRTDVWRALAQVKTWHEGQFRHSGDPFVVHPIATALFLAKLECKGATLIAGLLHDVVEDGCTTFDEVERLFGAEVRVLVDAVTKLTKLHYEGKRSERQIASLRKMLLVASDDLRVIFIKIADRLHNVETLHALPPDKQERIAWETLEIYVPFARMVGLWEVKRRFEEICFPIAFPREARQWHENIARRREELAPERHSATTRIRAVTQVRTEAHLTIMTDYELYQKCSGNLTHLRDAGSMDSIQVLPEDSDADARVCYELLGDVHRHFHVHPTAFRDFVSQPLPNGYRALHTRLFLAHDHQVLVRIQTKGMHEYATMRKMSAWVSDRENALVKVLRALSARAEKPEEYLQDLKENVLQGMINVVTPSGEIVTLPRGATGIDLAAALDTSFLTHLTAMRVNGEQREVTGELCDGDTAELLFSEGDGNGRDVFFRQRAKTIEAREDLRKLAGKLSPEKLREEGEFLLAHECSKYLLPLRWLFRFSLVQRELARRLQQKDLQSLLGQMGGGVVAADRVTQEYARLLSHPPGFFLQLLVRCHAVRCPRPLAPGAIVTIDVTLTDRPGVLHAITRCFAERGVNIVGTNTYEVSKGVVCDRLGVEVKDVQEFSDLYDALLQVPGVQKIQRVK
ncbi:HD domain-containing protein [Candidatus Peregrinibacteria bacterium]|nr:HD domain-containing protein [Candidatus Peregrinibacteria bacterium]